MKKRKIFGNQKPTETKSITLFILHDDVHLYRSRVCSRRVICRAFFSVSHVEAGLTSFPTHESASTSELHGKDSFYNHCRRVKDHNKLKLIGYNRSDPSLPTHLFSSLLFFFIFFHLCGLQNKRQNPKLATGRSS